MSLKPAALRTFTFAAGATVANFYYVQPLLVDIGRSFGLGEAAMGLAPTLTQFGLGFGVLFLLPLGDVIDNRRLISWAIAVQAVALLAMSVASNIWLFLAASTIMGFSGITSYILPPYVAHLAPSAQRGRVIAHLARGGMLGILLARTVAGFIGYHAGWRSVYFLAAFGGLVLLWLLRRVMEPVARPTTASYPHLLASLWKLIRTEPVVRRTVFIQAMNFGSFNCMWLGLSLYLESPAFGLHSDTVGLFGLLGAAAAFAAPLVGHLADNRSPQVSLRLTLGMNVIAWLLLLWVPGLGGVLAGVILLDIGASGSDISTRTILFRLHPDIRTRLMAVYAIGMFFCAAVVSFSTTVLWAKAGWSGVCLLGLAVTSIAFVFNLWPLTGVGENHSPNENNS